MKGAIFKANKTYQMGKKYPGGYFYRCLPLPPRCFTGKNETLFGTTVALGNGVVEKKRSQDQAKCR
jgi:hypothetical protein